jgi:hypothetical protein
MTDTTTPPTPETPVTTPIPETVAITDVNQFVGILTDWHAHKVAILEHMLQVPDGTEMQVDDGESIILTGDMLAGFKAGISIALMELGVLPFVAEMDPELTTDESVQAA